MKGIDTDTESSRTIDTESERSTDTASDRSISTVVELRRTYRLGQKKATTKSQEKGSSVVENTDVEPKVPTDASSTPLSEEPYA